jgi:hypothetical protein
VIFGWVPSGSVHGDASCVWTNLKLLPFSAKAPCQIALTVESGSVRQMSTVAEPSEFTV